MSWRSRRIPTGMAAALLVIGGAADAVAQTEAVVPPAMPVAANGAVEAQSDPLTNLARELAAAPTPAGAKPATLADREDLPLGRAAPTTAGAPEPKSPAGSGGWMISTLGSLGVVIGLILATRWAWTRYGGGVVTRSTPAVEVLSRTTVAPRNHVLLLRVGGRVLVVGDSSAGLRTLTEITEAEEVAGLLEAVTASRATSVSRGFAQVMSGTNRDYEALAEEEGRDGSEHRVDAARDSLSGLLSRMRTMQKGGTP